MTQFFVLLVLIGINVVNISLFIYWIRKKEGLSDPSNYRRNENWDVEGFDKDLKFLRELRNSIYDVGLYRNIKQYLQAIENFDQEIQECQSDEDKDRLIKYRDRLLSHTLNTLEKLRRYDFQNKIILEEQWTKMLDISEKARSEVNHDSNQNHPPR
jgi:hypothetical protein